jgi:hypothetical protein
MRFENDWLSLPSARVRRSRAVIFGSSSVRP